MKVITARIEEDCLEDLETIEKEEHADRAEVVRKLLASAIKDWKLKKALKLLKQRKITLRTAASIAGLKYLEMLDIVAEADIDMGYKLEDLKRDLKG